MANVVKKHSISSELARRTVDEAVAKARKIGVAENVAILDDGGNLKAFGRMDEAVIWRMTDEVCASLNSSVGFPHRSTVRYAHQGA
jgi:uncharacterized protein GlcG (DUF336 family)